MPNNIVLNPQRGDQFALTGVSSVYNQPSAFQPIGVTVYSTASIPANAGNALAGKALTIAGFAAPGNNGTFLVLASTATTVTTNNANGVVVVAAGTASFQTQGFPAGWASKIENLWSNQNGDSVQVNANAGDLIVAIAIGLKSADPFDLLHGTSPYAVFGGGGNTVSSAYTAGLNDFNANPTISDSSPDSVAITSITQTDTAESLTSVASSIGSSAVYTGTITGGAANALAGYYFQVAGFTTAANNGYFLCTASSGTTLTLSNAAAVAETHAATATDYVVSITTASNNFNVGDVVKLAGIVTETWLNGQSQAVVTAGAVFTVNDSTKNATSGPTAQAGATASRTSGNDWTLVANLNIADSDYTPSATPPTAPNPYPSSRWNTDGYYPSIYIWAAQNVTAGTYNVKLNSMYQPGVTAPQDYAAASWPIFDGGVNFQVIVLSGAAASAAVDAFSISTGSPADTTSNPATAPATLVATAADGDALISIGLSKNSNAFAVGTVGTGGVAGTGPAMQMISHGKLVGSEAHYIVEYALVAAGTWNPGFSNPLGYPMLIGSVAIKSS
jgi:hypothetical protein